MIDRVIFLGKNGTSRAPMAVAIFRQMYPGFKGEVWARGLVVAFEEPMNQKALAVLASDGIDMSDYVSSRISSEDITENTLVFTLDERIREGALSLVEELNEENTYEICKYSGQELEITDPYGGSLQTYGICYESLKNIIKKVVEHMEESHE